MTTRRDVAAVVLAAGKGTRMKSSLPKVLQPIGGQPMAQHVLDVIAALKPKKQALVISPDLTEIEDEFEVPCLVQDPPLGTAHAVLSARDLLDGFSGVVLILFADTPLLEVATLEAMIAAKANGAELVALGFRPKDPTGYGRLIVGDGNALDRIVEHADATAKEREISLCNSGVLAVDGDILFELLDKVTNDNAKGEYYLPDIVQIARRRGLGCSVVEADSVEVMGVDSKIGLAKAEAAFQDRARRRFMEKGVTLFDPSTVYFSHDTIIGADVSVGQNVVFGPCVRVGDGVEIKPFCHFEDAVIGDGAIVGPYARLRPGARVGQDAHIGNFVEIKNAVIDTAAKVNHLTYIGDAVVGARSNVGAGTITCNYDGFNKYLTVIGADVFIGSNTSLVAPVRISDGANTGAGSVITTDVEANALGVERSEQKIITGWATKYRARKSAEKAAGKGAKPNPVEWLKVNKQ